MSSFEKTSDKPKPSKRRCLQSDHSPLNAKADETYVEDKSNIEDCISFYNFGYKPKDEEDFTRAEEMRLLPYKIDMDVIHGKRYEIRDRWPSAQKNYDTSLTASGRALYAERRLELLVMRQEAAYRDAPMLPANEEM
ncbi:hypothetical protein G6011_05453 [Alternaria panax]|uniref:Uncharacterized protein n=1 Tax=Alternaria panax TaxID=48097 RepID=A0AAD4FCK8_9PLEO|nr:hypothetical protein G6011_05453 [Alternaria panax]